MTVTVWELQEIWGRLKRWVFKRKTDIDDADVAFSGSVFHSRAAVTGKGRSPMVERWASPTTSDDDEWRNCSARYVRVVLCRHLYARTDSLNLMRSGTFNECSCVRSGVMRSYLDAESTSRVAEFITHCIRLIRWEASVALP